MTHRSIDEWRQAGVTIGEEVDPERIAPDVVIHPGCRILGAKTSIGPECILGEEAPATVEDCRLGHRVRLRGGYFSGSTFLDRATLGSGAHVRPGTLIEEEAGGAHAVGLKQTVFFPFVTAGSLINFCDALMAGGTGRSDHSEIGSSYVHFNFTPHKDKATPSLIGDVPNGVFLDKPPIFLGGQGGLVGPSRIAFGTVVAAGAVCRSDILVENQLHIPAVPERLTGPYETGVYRSIHRLVRNNLIYIGNIIALQAWYRLVRSRFMSDEPYRMACHEGALECLELILNERMLRMSDLATRMEDSARRLESGGGPPEMVDAQHRFRKSWPELAQSIRNVGTRNDQGNNREKLILALGGSDYLACIKMLDPEAKAAGQAWLQSIVDGIGQLWSD